MSVKQLLKDLAPPLLVRAARRLTKASRPFLAPDSRPEWEYVPQGWNAEKSDPAIKGWNVQSVLDTYRAKWDAFARSMHGTGPFAVSPEAPAGASTPDLRYHNQIMTFAYALALSTQGKSSLSILDWGGGIGHFNLIARSLLRDTTVFYSCKDVPILAEYGQTLFPEAHFYSDEQCLSHHYDLVMASTSLQYSRDWRETFRGLASASAGYLLVMGFPVAHRSASFVFLQRPSQYGYDTEYLAWCVNREEFLGFAEQIHLELVREFIDGRVITVTGAPESCDYRGYLFRPVPRQTPAG